MSRLFKEDKPDICPNCGNACAVNDVFCPKCGKNLDELFDQLEDGAEAVSKSARPEASYAPPMRLSRFARTIIAAATILVFLYPMLIGLGWLAYFPRFFSSGEVFAPTPAFRIFSFLWSGICFISLVQAALVAFYLIHIIKNTAASDTARILLGIGLFFLAAVAMPVYYYLYLRERQPPAWALAQPGRRPARATQESHPPVAQAPSVFSPAPSPAEGNPALQPQSLVFLESQPAIVPPTPEQLLADLQGENYHAKLAALKYVRENQVGDERILARLSYMANSGGDRYLRVTASKTLAAIREK